MHAFIDKFMVVHFDDILVYSKSLKEQVENLRRVLQVLIEETLYANLKKYIFCMKLFFSWLCC